MTGLSQFGLELSFITESVCNKQGTKTLKDVGVLGNVGSSVFGDSAVNQNISASASVI